MGKQKSAYYRKRHTRFNRFFRWLLRPVLCRKFAFSYDEVSGIGENYIVLANHNTDFDPLLISLVFQEFMYFVTSEHVMRAGIASRLLNYIFAPISRIKGSVASSTVLQILRRLRDGHNICMFAEGNRSFDGNTCLILPATAKLVKSSGAALITYHFEGGYFTSPRWSLTLRRGMMRGYVKRIYPSALLKTMSTDEIYQAICDDLSENAYETQARLHIPYHGRRLAEGLETALYLCPVCGQIGTLCTTDSQLTCSCGLHAVYTEYGEIQNAPFSSIADWDAWQTRELQKRMAVPDFSISDPSVSLAEVDEYHHTIPMTNGKLSMTRDQMTVGEQIFPLCDISQMALCGRNIIMFTCADRHYEIRSASRYCARKYQIVYQTLY